ncbi:hypothetical protein [Bacillus fungorum]|uniref:hypothetical protein n=1 Tax=Bacillus fungorum TaxID=2039284 RepID=UPI0010A9A5F7|nr:hypothetical protein [Bacillus fungorum]
MKIESKEYAILHIGTEQNNPFCDIGKQINKLGTALGGTYVGDKPKKRTKVEWDVLCEKTLIMQELGMTYDVEGELLLCEKNPKILRITKSTVQTTLESAGYTC